MQKFYENYKLYLILALVAGIIIRFYGLAIQSFWMDELYTILSSSGSYNNFLSYVVSDTHPPLYQSIMYIWIHIFGASETTARFPSAIFGSLSLFALYFCSKKYFGSIVAASATVMLSFMFTGIAYSQEARCYTLFMLFSIISTFAMMRLIQDRPRNVDYSFYVIIATITAYTHYFGAILIGLQFIYLLVIAVYFNKKELNKIIPAAIFLSIAYLPWINVLKSNFHLINSGAFWIPPVQLLYFKEYLRFIFYPDQILLLFSIICLFILPYLVDEKEFIKKFMISVRSTKVTSPSFILCYLIICTIVPTYIISVIWKPILIPRYVLHLAPFVYLLGASWLSNCSRLSDYKQVAYVLTICIICFSFFSMIYYTPQKEQWREATNYAVNESNNKTMLITISEFEQDYYNYYLNKTHMPTGMSIYKKGDFDNMTYIISKMHAQNKDRLVILSAHFQYLNENDYDILNSTSKSHNMTAFIGANVSVYQF